MGCVLLEVDGLCVEQPGGCVLVDLDSSGVESCGLFVKLSAGLSSGSNARLVGEGTGLS